METCKRCLIVFSIFLLCDSVKPEELFDIQLTNRLIGGINATDGQFPWHASLIGNFIYQGKETQRLCGASLIDHEWILTAAHCLIGLNSVEVGLGSIDLLAPRIEFFFDLNVYVPIIHPEYNDITKNNDVALLKLPGHVQYNDYIQPIRLPWRIIHRFSWAGFSGRVSGFGRMDDDSIRVSQYMQWLAVQIVENSVCAKYYTPGSVINSTLCATGYDDPLFSTCGGDSGGALVVSFKKVHIQVGIVSFVASNKCSSGIPGGYVRLSSFIDWIQDKTNIEIF